MFEKSLGDLIRGIRAHAADEAKYISAALEDCRKELRSDSQDIKTNAVAKLTYLQMLGYDVSFAAFNMVEVMSYKKFSQKRVGYLAASQCFHEGTDVLMLTTNMIKKDLLSGQNTYEVGLALNGLSNFITPDLARDLANDIMSLMTSTKPYVRKRATLITYRVFLRFPEALRPAFQRLKDKLEDDEPGVQASAVNVICELARKNPKNYLSLAPIFFKILTTSQSNWVRIKVIKLLAALMPLEPRLAKKMIEPLTSLIHQTPAMSLLYECINTVVVGMPEHLSSIQLCVQKLRIFIEDPDPNLKYLGLQAMANVLKVHPKAVSAHREVIVACLDDQDESIRLRSLDLLAGMVTKKTLTDIVRKLLTHIEHSDGLGYRDEVISKIVNMCSQSNYQFITNFEWYLQVLIQLTTVEGTRHGKLIANQLMDVAIRVKVIREFATKQMAALLDNQHLQSSGNQQNGICEILFACAWAVGEFAEFVEEPLPVLEALLQPRVTSLPGHIQSVYVHNTLKLYGAVAARSDGEEDAKQMREIILQRMPLFVQSGDLEVQERAVTVLEIMNYLAEKDGELDGELAALFEGELNPVAVKAQRKVPVPEGLNLDKWINDPPEDSSDEEMKMGGDGFSFAEEASPYKKTESDDEETRAMKKEQRRISQEQNPFHLGAGPARSVKSPLVGMDRDELADIPVTKLDLGIPLTIDFPSSHKKRKLTKKQRKKMRKKGIKVDDEDDYRSVAGPAVEVSALEEMPEGAVESDDDDDELAVDDPHRALNIDLTTPLDESEMMLPVASHHTVAGNADDESEEAAGSDKKSKKKKNKKEKKSKKDKKTKTSDKSSSLLDIGAVPASAPAAAAAAAAPAGDDLDFWLGGPAKTTSATTATVEPVVNTSEEEPAEQKKSKKAKKEKKAKSSKKEKKKKSIGGDDGAAAAAAAPVDLIGDGVGLGQPPTSAYRPLIEDEGMSITFDTAVSPTTGNQVCFSLLINNKGADQISKMEITVIDSMNAKLQRPPGSDDSIAVPFSLASGITNEQRLVIDVQSISMPQKLKGSISFMVGDSGNVTQKMLNFRLPIPCSTFIYPSPCSKEQFAALLSGGDMCQAQSFKKDTAGQSFAHILAYVCMRLHLCVVEQVGTTASLYCVSTEGKHLCALLKATDSAYSMDFKCNDAAFLGHVVEELKS